MKFLLVEDNRELADALSSRLKSDGHAIDHAPTIEEAEAFVAVGEYDLILLDMMLPDGDGRGFLNRHRQARRDTPVIVLTARSQVSDRITLLDLGADDYVTKPFDHAELEARCRAVMRRRAGASRSLVQIGAVEFDPLAGTLTIDGNSVKLRNRELRLLELFVTAPGQLFSKQKLVDRLFSLDEEVSDNAIEVYVGRLRRHLDGSGLRIVTSRGLGYSLEHD